MLPLAAVFAQYSSTLDLSDRTEIRARSTIQLAAPAGQQSGITVAPAVDAFTQPEARLVVANRTWQYIVSSFVGLTVPDILRAVGREPLDTDEGLVTFGGATASVRYRAGRLLVDLSETGSLGRQNSAFLFQTPTAPGQTTVVQTAPQPTTILTGSTDTVGNIGLRLSPRAEVSLRGEYIVSGGINSAAKQVLPEQYGPRASGIFDYTVSKRDRLLTTVSAQSTRFTNGECLSAAGLASGTLLACAPEDQVASVGESLRHLLTRRADLTLGAGVAVARTKSIPHDPFSVHEYPTAEAAVSVRFGDRAETATAKVDLLLVPYIDARTGIVSDRFQGTVSLVDILTSRVTVQAAADLAQTITPLFPSDPSPATIVSAELEADFRVNRQIDLSLGERAFWQNQEGYGTFISAFGFFGVTVRDPTLHF